MFEEINLPKWPQCVIFGKDITEKQALEIIRRTDTFFSDPFMECGNNIKLENEIRSLLKINRIENWNKIRYIDYYDKLIKWRKKWGIIETNFIFNSWVSCSWVGGCHGWCNPNGKIKFYDNIGKYPTVESVYKDWSIIAENFPFLDIYCTLMNGESGEFKRSSVVSIRIKNGTVNILKEPIPVTKLGIPSYSINYNFFKNKENYFSLKDIKNIWGDHISKL